MLGEGERELFAKGRAPCVVALHGFGGTVAELRPLLERIGRAGFAIDAALLPGHGTRVEELQEATFDAWVEAARARARAALAAHGRIILLGFSLGSLLAMRLASERPEGLAGLVVLGNALTLRLHTSLPLALWARFMGKARPLPDVYLLKPRAGDLVDASAMDALVTYDRHPLRAAMEVWRAGERVRGIVGRIACPTLVLHGRRDLVCSFGHRVPHARPPRPARPRLLMAKCDVAGRSNRLRRRQRAHLREQRARARVRRRARGGRARGLGLPIASRLRRAPFARP
jgi:carboxylesterase